MKRKKIAPRILATFIVLSLVFTSCTQDENDSTEAQQQNLEELRMSSEMDDMETVLEDVVITAYEDQETAENRMANAVQAYFSDCVTITAVLQLNHRELTIDFGTEGCFVNGHLLKGQIVVTYDRDPEAQEVMLNYTLVDFYINLRQLIGTRTILRELSNENGNPQFTHTLNLTVIWPNGAQATRDGLKVREWVEGFGDADFTNDVFEITGHWNSTFVNGNTHSHEVIIPLRRELTCAHFVSGSIDVERTYFSGVLDFGEGACDNQATFTFDGGDVVNITLN